MESSSTEIGSLKNSIELWNSFLEGHDPLRYVWSINERYDSLANWAESNDLTELRLMRSIWAKHVIDAIIYRSSFASDTAATFRKKIEILSKVRGLITPEGIKALTAEQQSVGDKETSLRLSEVLGDFGDPSAARPAMETLDSCSRSLRVLGPKVVTKIRPVRKSGRNFDSEGWLQDASMSQVEYVNNDPDWVKVRGIELRSGDIGIVELNRPGDGLQDSFLTESSIASHAMLYVTRRVLGPGNETLYQPSLIEIYEGGWRSVPLTTGLSPHFSWYSEWVRPPRLPEDIGQRICKVLDDLETISFDFQSRKAPLGGFFSKDFGTPSASCTNLIRIIFERAGVSYLPYRTTKVVELASKNLELIGIHIPDGIYTPTDILRDPANCKIGIVDNGMPEFSYAQAIVHGRPEFLHTFGGMISQRDLLLENLPNWRSVRQWRSALESLKIAVAQANGPLSALTCSLYGFKQEEIPMSASHTAIAYYLRSELISSDIICSVVHPAMVRWFAEGGSYRLSVLRSDDTVSAMVRKSIEKSDLEREHWYRPVQ